MKRIFSLFILISLASYAGAYNFYLSVNKVFGPEENAIVQVYSYNGNIDDVRYTLFKVNETEKFFQERVLGNGQSTIPDDMIKDLEIVKTWKEKISVRRYYSSNVDLGTLEPGAYVLEGLSGDEVSQIPVIVSKYGIIMRNSGEAVVAYVVDRSSGKHVRNFNMYGYVSDSTIRPDISESLAYFNIENSTNQYYYYMPVVATKGDDVAVSQTYFYNYYNQNNGRLKGYVFTDRSAYRPEQTVYFKGIFRNKDGFRYSVAKDSIVYTVYGPENNELAKKKVALDDNGAFNDSLYVEENWKLGDYTIKYGTNQTYYWYYNQNSNDCKFKVEEYKKPEYEVSVNLNKPQYVTGDKIEAMVSAKYFFGAPVANAEVTYKVVRKPHFIPYWYWYPWSWWYDDYYELYYGHYQREIVHTGTGQIEKDGTFKVEYQTKEENAQNYQYTVIADVRDASRRTISGSASAISSHTEFMLSVNSDKYYYTDDEDVSINVKSFDFSKNPVGTEYIVYVHRYDTYKNRWGYQSANWDKSKAVDTIHGRTDNDLGVGKVRFKTDGSGYFYFDVRALDSREKEVSSSCYAYVVNNNDRNYYWWQSNTGSVQIMTDKKVYRRGDKVNAMIYLPHEADALVTVHNKGFAHFKVYEFKAQGDKGATKEVEFEIDEHTFGQLQVHVAYMHDNQVYQYQEQITVIPDDEYLDVSIDFDQESYEPGQWATAKVVVKDHKGRPVPYADVTVATVDESIFSLYPDATQDIRKEFYSTEPSQNYNNYYSNYFNQYSYSKKIPVDGIQWRKKRLDINFDREVYLPKGAWYRTSYDESFEKEPVIHGYVMDYQSGEPIPRATVKVGNKTFKADQYGFYSIKGFSLSHATLTFYANGGSTTVENVALYSYRNLGLNVAVSNRKEHKVTIVEDVTITDLEGIELSEQEVRTRTETVATGGAMGAVAEDAAVMDEVALSSEEVSVMGKRSANSVAMVNGVAQQDKREAEKQLVEPEIRSDFRDAIYWNPTVKTNAFGIASVRFKMPDNLTTWRVTAKAITEDTKVGQAFKTVITKKDLLVRMETPRFMTAGDEMFIATNVHNYLATKKDVTVQLMADGLALKGTERKITVDAHGEQRVDWTIAAKWVLESKLTVKAMTDEKSDAMEMTVPVLPYGLEMVKAQSTYLSNSGTENMDVNIPEDVDLNTVDLELSTAPSISSALLNSMDDLIGYPYGCVEQTMSRFMPNVVVANTLKNLGGDYTTTIDKAELRKMVAQGTKRLKELQHDDGGWGWWENDETRPIMTAYVTYGLYLAKKAGYDVEKAMYSNAERALLSQLANHKGMDETTYAYQMMVAMSMGHKDKWNKTSVPDQNADPYTTALWAQAAYHAGDMKTAKIKAAHLTDQVVRLGSAVHWGGKRYYYRWQDDNVETTAHAIKALSLVDPDNDLIPKAVQWLMSQRRGNSWYNTRQTAYSILGLQEIIKKEYNPNFELTLYVNDIMIDKFKVTPKDVHQKGNIYHIKGETFMAAMDGASERFTLMKHGANTIRIEQEGKGGSYVNAKLKYFLDGEHELTKEEKEKQVFEVDRVYYKLTREQQKNGTWIYRKSEIDKSKIESGDDILVKTKVKAPSAYEYVLIEDPIPAGCEFIRDMTGYRIEGESIYDGTNQYWNYRYWGWWNWNRWYTHQEYRDEKYALTITNMNSGQYEYSYLMKAQIPGEFKVNPAVAQLMYYPETRGFSDFGSMTILDD